MSKPNNKPLQSFLGKNLQAKVCFKSRKTNSKMETQMNVEVVGVDHVSEELLCKPLTKDSEILDHLPSFVLKVKQSDVSLILSDN